MQPQETEIILMTARAPVRIQTAAWPVIAQAEDQIGHGPSPEFAWQITVRRHADGRVLVYGSRVGAPVGDERDPLCAGYLYPNSLGLVTGIRQVEREIWARDGLSQAVLSRLPAEDI